MYSSLTFPILVPTLLFSSAFIPAISSIFFITLFMGQN